MDKNYTTTIQEVRRDPVGFLRQVNKGRTVTVIYRSKPFSVVTSAEQPTTNTPKSIQRMLEYAELARKSAKSHLDTDMDYKKDYGKDMAKKYGIS